VVWARRILSVQAETRCTRRLLGKIEVKPVHDAEGLLDASEDDESSMSQNFDEMENEFGGIDQSDVESEDELLD
jgi:hypothetical protein